MSFSLRADNPTVLALDIFGVFAPAHLRSRRGTQDLQGASVGSGVDLGLRSSHPTFSLGKATRVGMAGNGACNPRQPGPVRLGALRVLRPVAGGLLSPTFRIVDSGICRSQPVASNSLAHQMS